MLTSGALNVDLRSNLRGSQQLKISMAIICCLEMFPSYNSLSSTLQKPKACIFDEIYEKFSNLIYFYLEDIDLGSRKLHVIEIFYQTTFPKNLVILAFIGAELAGGHRFCPPTLPWRLILDPIQGRGLMAGCFHFKKQHCQKWILVCEI